MISSTFRFFFQRPKYFQGLLLVAFDSHVAVLCIEFAFRKLPRLRFPNKYYLIFKKVLKCTIIRYVLSMFRSFFQGPKYFQGLLLVALGSPVAVLCIAFAFRKLPRLRLSKGIISVFKKFIKCTIIRNISSKFRFFFNGQNISRSYYWLHSRVILLFYGLHSLSGKYHGCGLQKNII